MIHNKWFILQTIPAVQVLVSENLLCSLGLEFHLLQVELVIQPLSKWPPWAPPLVGRTRNTFLNETLVKLHHLLAELVIHLSSPWTSCKLLFFTEELVTNFFISSLLCIRLCRSSTLCIAELVTNIFASSLLCIRLLLKLHSLYSRTPNQYLRY